MAAESGDSHSHPSFSLWDSIAGISVNKSNSYILHHSIGKESMLSWSSAILTLALVFVLSQLANYAYNIHRPQHAIQASTSWSPLNESVTIPFKYLSRNSSIFNINATVVLEDAKHNETSAPQHAAACEYLLQIHKNQSQLDMNEFSSRFRLATPKLLFPELLKFICERTRQLDKVVMRQNGSDVHIVHKKSDNNPHTSKCPFNFSVYVYPVSEKLSSLRVAEEARRNRTLHVCRKCILEQFSLEYIIYDFFTQFCGRTADPSKADFFYIPMVRDAELRWLMERGLGKHRPPFPAEEALLDLLEKNNTSRFKDYFHVSDRWWLRNQGADHIIGVYQYRTAYNLLNCVVMPAPVTNLRHERNARGFFHYMLHLHNPIFIAIEYSKSFIQEYPICSRSKNILVPYPTIDPELYSHKWAVPPITANRSALLFYSGGLHGDCVQVREALHRLVKNSTKIAGILPPGGMNMAQRESGFLSSTFCPVPIGDSPSSKRMYDVLNFGCIPVILSDDLVWAYSNYSGGSLDPYIFSIQLPQSVVQYSAKQLLTKFSRLQLGFLPKSGIAYYDLLSESLAAGGEYLSKRYVNPLVQILLRIPYQDIVFLRKNIRDVAPLYRYYRMKAMTRIPIAHHRYPDGGAILELARQLEFRKISSVTRTRELCKAERERKGHVYVSRYPCDDGRARRRVL